jgi:hypothetical protein
VGLVCLERAALSTGAGQADFWYFGLHDAYGRELIRKDLDRAAVRAAMADTTGPISLSCDSSS